MASAIPAILQVAGSAIASGKALPYLGAANSLYSMYSGAQANNRANEAYRNAANAPRLSYEEALARSGDVLNPIWDKNLNQTLASTDNANMARGFYGQLAGDALRNSRASDIQGQRMGQISSLANQMVDQNSQNALAQQQLAMQYAMNTGQLGTSLIGQGISGAYTGAQDWGNMVGMDIVKLGKAYEANNAAGYSSPGNSPNSNAWVNKWANNTAPWLQNNSLLNHQNPLSNGSLNQSFNLQTKDIWKQ